MDIALDTLISAGGALVSIGVAVGSVSMAVKGMRREQEIFKEFIQLQLDQRFGRKDAEIGELTRRFEDDSKTLHKHFHDIRSEMNKLPANVADILDRRG
jgi:hypothetical protein